ncbi:Sodium channel protein type 11 subunit alpha [Symbiodinium microadriaticum]|uniref:Sodium channel protein type 11 subunit alpha n=1 Tax=Symbiodinium microadriaticum TaxID=2951 RepID=A0A1Q9ELZ5_SYMMI|nr:Sodium channel protein type 11 subunit alpha [Symbiodinium microadriaticum]
MQTFEPGSLIKLLVPKPKTAPTKAEQKPEAAAQNEDEDPFDTFEDDSFDVADADMDDMATSEKVTGRASWQPPPMHEGWWERLYDERSRCEFFWNSSSQLTLWHLPLPGTPHAMLQPVQPAVFSSDLPFAVPSCPSFPTVPAPKTMPKMHERVETKVEIGGFVEGFERSGLLSTGSNFTNSTGVVKVESIDLDLSSQAKEESEDLEMKEELKKEEDDVKEEKPLKMEKEEGAPVAYRIFTFIFALDVLVRMFVLKGIFWKAWLNYIDIAVSVTNIFETAISMYSSSTALPFPPVLFRLLRLGKLARAIRVVSMTSVLASLQLLVKCLGSSRDMLFWSFCLLTFVQCVAGMILSTLTIDFIKDDSKPSDVRGDVFLYYGTFSRTTLSMFEILFANWSPCCRILVENVSEWFSVFFLLYRCVLGFAILNVVNSVFVQQTMKTASSDEELAFKQKQRDAELYTKKVRKLFQTMDASGDGAINLEEFAKLVQSPKLRFWMSQLELEYHDLLSLFEFLDNGDGQITLTEFIEGAARLRGSAKALDIWRMETKVEVLFEEVLALLRTHGAIPPLRRTESNASSSEAVTRVSSVQDVFNNSCYHQLQSTAQQKKNVSSGLDVLLKGTLDDSDGGTKTS